MRENVINLKVCVLLTKCLLVREIMLIALILFQVVLANGEVVKTGSRARKSAAGYGPCSESPPTLVFSPRCHLVLNCNKFLHCIRLLLQHSITMFDLANNAMLY